MGGLGVWAVEPERGIFGGRVEWPSYVLRGMGLNVLRVVLGWEGWVLGRGCGGECCSHAEGGGGAAVVLPINFDFQKNI